ncbi:MAG: hypothetical protein K0V04_36525 [Deltaproteobacteria bacterium]|nr:hypothetical protein [Deltaproteobacteria bacterium]
MLDSHVTVQNSQVMAALALGAMMLAGCPGDDGSAEGGTDATTTPTTGSADATEGDETATSPTGCGVTPGPWSAPQWDDNAAAALAIRDQLDMLTGDATMRGAETGAVMVSTLADLTAVWDGDPSLAAVANPGYVPVIEAAFDEFLQVLAAGEQDLVDDQGIWTPGMEGGVWAKDTRGINEGGIEVRQLIDKGGYSGGITYAYALGLTEGDLTPATIDAIAAAWGNNAALDPEGELTDAAGYSLSMGFHASMASALTDAKEYAEDEACTVERDEALVTFFRQWEQVMLARLVFYGNRAEGRLLTAASDTELAAVLHDLAEGLGVAVGYWGLPEPTAGPLAGAGRIITDDEISQVADAFGLDLGELGASTTGTLLESLPNLESAVTSAEGVVMDVYGVDAATIATYAMPVPG